MNYFLGQIIILPFGFAPKGFAFCDGQLLEIAQYLALFSLIGTTFGGNGTTDFALPDYSGKAPAGSNYFICIQEPAPQA
jgi:microcystin-dependent protein